MGRTLKLGNAVIIPEVHIGNPLVLASYQGYHEICKYFELADARIKYLESLLNEKGISYDQRTAEAFLSEPTSTT